MKKVLDSFFNEEDNNFLEYFEKQRDKNLTNREDYKKLNKEIDNLITKYPRVQQFLEDENIEELSHDEMKTILDIIDLQEEIKVLELKEAFKLGEKEVYIFFEEMRMIKREKSC